MMSDESRDELNQRQEVAYENHRTELVKWLSRMGKDPEKLEGYAHHTAKVYASVLDKFHRWAWEHRGGYTHDLSHQDADTYLRNMVMADNEYSATYLNNIKLALKAYFRYRNDADEWEPSISISSDSGAKQPRTSYTKTSGKRSVRQCWSSELSHPTTHLTRTVVRSGRSTSVVDSGSP